MKVILKENFEDLGKKGDIVKVAPGYGRNYLIPKKIALEVTPTNTKMIEMVQKSLRKGLEKEMATYQTQVDKLNAVSLTFERKAGEKDAIFGSVSVTDIRDALAELGLEIEKKRILLDEPIKRLGNYSIPIKVFHDQKAEIKLEVSKEGAAAEEVKAGDVTPQEEKAEDAKAETKEDVKTEAKTDEAEPAKEEEPEPAPTEETPVEKAPAEEAPVEEKPVEDAAVEQTDASDESVAQEKKDE
jgi:large subunit ribosomal protein L9